MTTPLTPQQIADCHLLLDLQTDPKRAAIVIAANIGITEEEAKRFVKLRRWPDAVPVQQSLFGEDVI